MFLNPEADLSLTTLVMAADILYLLHRHQKPIYGRRFGEAIFAVLIIGVPIPIFMHVWNFFILVVQLNIAPIIFT